MARLYPKDLIFGAVIWFGLATVLAIAFFPPSNGQWAETGKAIGVAVAIAGGIFSPISAIVMARYQNQLTTDLAKVSAEYSQQVEILKRSLSTSLEVRKALIAGNIRAFDTMLTAGHFYYYVIRQAVYRPDLKSDELLVEADRRAAEASSVVWHLSTADRQKWFSVYQISNYLIDIVSAAKGEERQKIFEAHAGKLGDALNSLEEAGRTAFNEADRYSLKIPEDEFAIFNKPK